MKLLNSIRIASRSLVAKPAAGIRRAMGTLAANGEAAAAAPAEAKLMQPEGLLIYQFPAPVKKQFIHHAQQHYNRPAINGYTMAGDPAARAALGTLLRTMLENVARSSVFFHTAEDRHHARKMLHLTTTILQGSQADIPPAFVIRQGPVDAPETLLETPKTKEYDWKNPQLLGKTGFMTETYMLAFMNSCGMHPRSDPYIQHGFPFHQVSQRVGGKQGTHLSAEYFPNHTESAYQQTPPDFVLLATLKNRNTPTIIIPVKPLIENALKSALGDDFPLLEKPWYVYSAGNVYGNSDDPSAKAEANKPICEKDEHGNLIRWRLYADLERIAPAPWLGEQEREKAQAIIHSCAKVLDSFKQGYCSAHGDLMVINNRKTVHSRWTFAPQDEWFRQLVRSLGDVDPPQKSSAAAWQGKLNKPVSSHCRG